MATSSMGPLIRHLRKILNPAHGSNVSDSVLLARFVQQRDEAAFELLLWRHQRMVLGVCRRVLGHVQDAEDAFQATFLTLARKADSLRRHRAVTAWLHKVAYHIALRARKNAAKRKTEDLNPADLVSVSGPEDEAVRRDVAAVLDEEVNRLPEKYRLPVVLCYLEGKTYQEVGRQLGVPIGTVSARLTRARDLLRTRLLRRGVVVSSAGLTAALMPDALASAGVSSLIGSLIRAAGAVAGGGAPVALMSARTLALTEGMLRMMFMTKVKIVLAASIVVTVAAAGLATLSHTTRAADTSVVTAEEPHTAAPARLSAKPRKETPPVQDDTHEQKDGIAWGKAVHGVQAGIAYRPGDQTIYEVGQSVTFVVYLRNVSAKTIRVSYLEPLFQEGAPEVEDAKGQRLAVATGPIRLGRVPVVERSLAPAQQITLGYPWFRIREMGWRGEIIGPTCCAESGHYEVGYIGFPLRLNDAQEDIFLGTKTVELDIGKGNPEEPSRRSVDPLKSSSRDIDRNSTVPMKRMTLEGANSAVYPRLYYVPARAFRIPVSIGPNLREQTNEIFLLASTDAGKTYNHVGKQPATAKVFDFKANEDGMYWFLIQQVDKQGRCTPEHPDRVKPTLRVCVDTKRPSTQLAVKGYRSKGTSVVELNIWCKAIDANLDEDCIALEWSEKPDGPWTSIVAPEPKKIKDGEFFISMHWAKNLPERIHVRLRAKDKAGNVTIDTQTFEIKELPEPERRLKPTGG